MDGMNGGEFLIIALVAMIVLGPSKLPEYAAALGKFVRNVKSYAEGAKAQLETELGPEFKDIDWKQYDPRQYDPRRIVQEALLSDPAKPDPYATRMPVVVRRTESSDPPYDDEAT